MDSKVEVRSRPVIELITRGLHLHVGSRNVQRLIALFPGLKSTARNLAPARQHPGGGCAGTVPVELVGVLPSVLKPPIPTAERVGLGGRGILRGVGGIRILRRHCGTVG